ncbi:MAG: CD3324 family protein [Butyrivibrio sp.]|nr:CD3324 family protein [Butyrivibrio sp.]
MGYIRAEEILPAEIIETIQQYVDGASIYIPRRAAHRQEWGAGTRIRQELSERDRKIYEDRLMGESPQRLARKYFLSEKSIWRILRKMG